MMQQLPESFEIWKGSKPIVSVKCGILEVYPNRPEDIEVTSEKIVFKDYETPPTT